MTTETRKELDAMKREVSRLYQIARSIEATGNFEDSEALYRTADELSARIGAVELSLAPADEETPGDVRELIAA
jgi:hypothetical protein